MENPINIGTLDTLVTVLHPTQTKNAQGAKGFSFSDFRQVYANVDRRMDEQVSIGNLEDGQYIYLTIYKIPQLTTRWRVRVDGRVYEITAIDPLERVSPLCILSLHAIG